MINSTVKFIVQGWFRTALMMSALSFCLLTLCSLTFSPTVWAEQQANQELLTLLKKTIEQADSFNDKYDAEVWLVSKSQQLQRYIPDSEKRLSLLRKIHRAATQADLSPEIVLAVIQIESAFDPYALSYAGAQGLMQVMPFWKKEIGRPDDNLMDIDTNLRYGCTILKFYLDKEKGHLSYALARYNGSYGKSWYPEKVLVAWERWR